MNKNQIFQSILLCGIIISMIELLYGIDNIDNDPCSDDKIFINLPCWFIFKGCITLNLSTLLYAYWMNTDERSCDICLVYFSWLFLFIHLAWVIVGCDFFWNQCLDLYVDSGIHIIMWTSIVGGMLMFLVNLRLLFAIHLEKTENNNNNMFVFQSPVCLYLCL